MDMTQNTFNANTLIPIGLSVSVFIFLCGFVWYAATLNARVESNMERVMTMESRIVTVPTRIEFDALKSDITEIKQDIKTLLTQ